MCITGAAAVSVLSTILLIVGLIVGRRRRCTICVIGAAVLTDSAAGLQGGLFDLREQRGRRYFDAATVLNRFRASLLLLLHGGRGCR